MRALLLAALLVLPSLIIASPKAHKIRLTLNVVDDAGGIAQVSSDKIGKFMFKQMFEEDPNLAFIQDIGFKHIKSIMVDMHNDTNNTNQIIVVQTSEDRIIVKEVQFFIYHEPQPRYVFTPDRFIARRADRDLYYLASIAY
jgi:hypothetical protein